MIIINLPRVVSNGLKFKLRPTVLNAETVSKNRVKTGTFFSVSVSPNTAISIHGFDLNQIEKARSEAESGKRVRGASTISQQTVKNVFLWPGKSYVRKGIEAYFTVLVEFMWGKKRIMEVYLNSIEMGEGIYGAEAVAYAHFGKAAYQLNRRQAALIAASLPNPRRFDSSKPSPYMVRRQAKIMKLNHRSGYMSFDERTYAFIFIFTQNQIRL